MSLFEVGSGGMFGFRGDFGCSESPLTLRSQQFTDADQVIDDQVEQEVGSDAGDAAMFGLTHRAVLLAPTEDAFGHRSARLRHGVAFVPRGTSVDRALPALAS